MAIDPIEKSWRVSVSFICKWKPGAAFQRRRHCASRGVKVGDPSRAMLEPTNKYVYFNKRYCDGKVFSGSEILFMKFRKRGRKKKIYKMDFMCPPINSPILIPFHSSPHDRARTAPCFPLLSKPCKKTSFTKIAETHSPEPTQSCYTRGLQTFWVRGPIYIFHVIQILQITESSWTY